MNLHVGVRVLTFLGLFAAVIPAVALLFLPMYQSTGVDASGMTIPARNGLGAILAIVAPVGLMGGLAWASLHVSKRRWRWLGSAGATLLLVFVVLTGFSIGLLYLPTVAFLVSAVFLAWLDRLWGSSRPRPGTEQRPVS